MIPIPLSFTRTAWKLMKYDVLTSEPRVQGRGQEGANPCAGCVWVIICVVHSAPIGPRGPTDGVTGINIDVVTRGLRHGHHQRPVVSPTAAVGALHIRHAVILHLVAIGPGTRPTVAVPGCAIRADVDAT